VPFQGKGVSGKRGKKKKEGISENLQPPKRKP